MQASQDGQRRPRRPPAPMPVSRLYPAGILLFSSFNSTLASITAIALRFVAMGSYRQQAGHSENGVFLPTASGNKRFLPLYPPQLANATPGLGFAVCLVNLVVSAIVTAGAAYLLKRKRPWKLLVPEQFGLAVVLIVNVLAITGALTHDFAFEATSARFDTSLDSSLENRTFTLETWTCDVGGAFPTMLGETHEFQLQCVMSRAARWLWILLWLFAMGVVVGGIWDAKKGRVLIKRKKKGGSANVTPTETRTGAAAAPLGVAPLSEKGDVMRARLERFA